MAKIKSPFIWSIEADPTNSKIFISKISPLIFDTLYIYGINSVSEYEKKLTKNKFNKYLKSLFNITDENLKDEYKNVSPVLIELLEAHKIELAGSTPDVVVKQL
jgi:hypothetical protein